MSKLEALADRALELQIVADEAKERFEEAKTAFLTELKAQGKFDPSTKAIGNARIEIKPNRYFDVETALTKVTKKVIKECEVAKVDPKLLKKHMTQIQIEESMKSYPQEFKVGLKVLVD